MKGRRLQQHGSYDQHIDVVKILNARIRQKDAQIEELRTRNMELETQLEARYERPGIASSIRPGKRAAKAMDSTTSVSKRPKLENRKATIPLAENPATEPRDQSLLDCGQ